MSSSKVSSLPISLSDSLYIVDSFIGDSPMRISGERYSANCRCHIYADIWGTILRQLQMSYLRVIFFFHFTRVLHRISFYPHFLSAYFYTSRLFHRQIPSADIWETILRRYADIKSACYSSLHFSQHHHFSSLLLLLLHISSFFVFSFSVGYISSFLPFSFLQHTFLRLFCTLFKFSSSFVLMQDWDDFFYSKQNDNHIFYLYITKICSSICLGSP